ncbi:hypothetical protein CSAL01_07719 [Colletotrichum salicis]|uniref:Uncharacterized protein n=1 Tax=Colletotrichum salicis TaxID=1209931 RepID=A0A135UIJ9_9PEZI|nr:hypothetical protein CSAL01_07719 [Colletotrichum salicis]
MWALDRHEQYSQHKGVFSYPARELTEEYFDEIAWPAYKAYHTHHESWDDELRHATHNELLRWAVSQIFRLNGTTT